MNDAKTTTDDSEMMDECEPPTEFVAACGSPLEVVWLRAFWCFVDSWRPMSIQPQARVGEYFADFLLQNNGGLFAAVEIDGHEFHQKTKEQAERDHRRDREFARRGIFVLRFTGSEVFRDPFGCAVEVVEFMERCRQ